MFNDGDLVRWHLVYDVGVVKSAGIGVIIGKCSVLWNEDEYPMYKVLRNGYNDGMVFEE